MIKTINAKTLMVILVTALILSACSNVESTSSDLEEADETVVGMPNPSAVYCERLGYSTEAVVRDGGADADCIFPDGSRCGAWDLFSGRCGQEFSYCEMHGGTIEKGANIGTCRFSDGSSCDEYQYLLGECSPGDNPGEVSEDIVSSEEEVIEIHDYSEARDFLAAYFLNQYGIEHTEPWMEQNITPENAGPSSTYRYVSGPLTIVITAEASAPYPSMYTIDEASFIVNGFYWEGTLSFDGNITETLVHPPGTILNEAQARDAILEFIGQTYDLPVFDEWTDEGFSHTGDTTLLKIFTSDLWIVEVEFEPSAPLVAKYHVTVENLSEGLRWEGEITLRGEIEEISFSK
jgi:putative hemolysin